MEIRSKKYLGVTGFGGRLKGAGKTNGIVSLYCDGYSLKQEGCFSRIRCGGGNALANVPYKRLALSTDGAKCFNGKGRKQIKLHQYGIFKGLALSCRLGFCAGRGGSGGRVGVCDGVSDC